MVTLILRLMPSDDGRFQQHLGARAEVYGECPPQGEGDCCNGGQRDSHGLASFAVLGNDATDLGHSARLDRLARSPPKPKMVEA